MRDKISVIIPYYNREKYIGVCLESVFNQSRQADEIIVVDDGSSAESALFLQKYANKVKIITLKNNAGPGNARNKGVEHAQGNLIAFLDSDDIWDRKKLAIQGYYMREHPECAASHTGATRFGFGSESTHNSKPSPLKIQQVLLAGHVAPPTFVIRKEVFQEVGGFDSWFVSSEENDLIIKLVMSGYQIHFIDKTLTKVRRENHGFISANWRRTLKGHIQVVWKHRLIYKHYGGNKAVRRQIGKYFCIAGDKCGRILGRLLKFVGIILGGKRPSIEFKQ